MYMDYKEFIAACRRIDEILKRAEIESGHGRRLARTTARAGALRYITKKQGDPIPLCELYQIYRVAPQDIRKVERRIRQALEGGGVKGGRTQRRRARVPGATSGSSRLRCTTRCPAAERSGSHAGDAGARERRREATYMSKSPENCTKPIWEECKLHPIDCDNCENEPGCRMKEDMRAHPDTIKRCRFFRLKGGS